MDANAILQEYGKCYSDPVYAIQNYFRTFDKTQEGFVPFKLFPRQLEIIDSYKNNRFNLVTKPRQAGVSTTTAAYLAISLGFADDNNPEKILILANKQKMAFEFLDKVRDFVTQLPRWVWGPEYYGDEKSESKDIYITNSKEEFSLPNGCRVKAVATSKDALRGYTPTFLVFDEAAFIDNGAEVFGAAMSSIGTGGKCTLISTPNGQDALYYNTYSKSMAGENDFNIVEMRWYEDLRYNKDLEWIKGEETIKETDFNLDSYKQKIKDGYKPTSSWYRTMCKALNNDERQIAQELDVSFVGSGANVINDEYVQWHKINNVREPQFVEGNEKEFWIWEQPKPEHKYVCAVDVARGDGADFSVFTIIDFTTMEQVVEYKGKLPPDLLAKVVVDYATLYDAYVVVDVIGVGATTVFKLMELGYKKLHYDRPSPGLLKNNGKLERHGKDGKVPGFNVSGVRANLVQNLEEYVRENKIAIRSTRVIAEMGTFVYGKNGKADHLRGANDDCLMTLGMAAWIIEHNFKQLEKNNNKAKAMLSSWIGNTGGVSANYNDRYKESTYNPKTFNKGPKTDGYKTGGDNRSNNMWLFSGLK